MTRFTGERLLGIANQNDVLDDPEVQKLILAAAVSDATYLSDLAETAVIGKAVQHRNQPFNLESTAGSVEIGETVGGEPVQLSQQDLTKHLLAVGQSGVGKTTLLYKLVTQLDVPFWSFDVKQDYRHLIHELDGLLVLPWTKLRFNPLVPPAGVSPRRWAQVVTEIFGHATALLSGSKNYLLKSLLELYRVYGLFEQDEPPYPSFHELEQMLASDPINYMRKASNYRDTVLNRVEAMNLGAGTIFDCSQGYGLEELLQRDVVFEFDGLSRDTQNFLMEVLMAAVSSTALRTPTGQPILPTCSLLTRPSRSSASTRSARMRQESRPSTS
jgi:hypothetical protein